MKQPDLFSMAPLPEKYPNGPGWTEPTTSKAAAIAVRARAPSQQSRILEFLTERGERGGTYTEIADGTGILPQSICGRMVELVKAGTAIKTETVRKTPHGLDAKVYRAVPK